MNVASFRSLLVAALGSIVLCAGQLARAADLSGSFQGLPAGSSVDLSFEGELDWAHWGLTAANSFDHKDFITQLITDYTALGVGSVQRTDTIGANYSWGDGTPTASAANSATAVLITGNSSGFQIRVPADALARRLKVYVGVYAAQGKLQADLSDGSAPAFTDTSLDSASGESNRVYSIDFAAGTSGQSLTVSFTVQAAHDATLGSVRLHSAALQNNFPPTITLNSPTNETVRPFPATILLDATADDFDVNGAIRKVDFFTNNVLLVTISNSPYTFTWTNAPPGAYEVTAIAMGNDGETASTDPATVYFYTNNGSLGVSVADTPAIVDLTAEGAADWAHWGLFREFSFNHKAGVASQISNFQFVTYGPAYQLDGNAVGYTWYDGTPTANFTNSTGGLYMTDTGDGFALSVPASTTTRTLKLYLGAFAARGRLRLLFSDGSTAPVFDSSVQNTNGTANAVYTINFRAGTTNQTLGVQYTVAQTFSSFGNVTLQAATLATGNLPPTSAITNIVSGAIFLAPTNLSIKATASDSDGSISKVEFFDGTTKLAQTLSSPYQWVWTNIPPGAHSLTARATDNNGATFTSPAVDLFVTTGGGMLSGWFAPSPSAADLSAIGALDWAHWGLSLPTSFNHRSNVPQQISGLAQIGNDVIQQFTGYSTTFTWSNGTPTLVNPGSTAGIFLDGLGSGFKITVPADPTKRRLKVFVGIYAALGRLQASLSDASAPDYVDYSLSNIWVTAEGCYIMDYAAASPNQALTVQFTSTDLYDVNYGNVSWEAATLALSGVRLTNLQKSGNISGFSFLTEPGESYGVEYTDALPTTSWNTLTTLLGDGSVTNIVDATATNARRFYRVTSHWPSP